MSQHHKVLRLNQAEGCSACSPVVGLRFAGSSLPGLVGQGMGRAAVPLLLTKASEKRDWGCWDLSPTPVFPVTVFPSIAPISYWEIPWRGTRHGLNSQLSFCCKKGFCVLNEIRLHLKTLSAAQQI